ncbi:MAG: hypothetical protein Q7W05_01325, partial [Deltaproteobacteria bacterium]|nr:hypothetical protein [Deltaproteobacteria bacterium]
CEQLAAALGGDAPCGYKGEGIILCDRITRSNLAESPGMAGGLPDLIKMMRYQGYRNFRPHAIERRFLPRCSVTIRPYA